MRTSGLILVVALTLAQGVAVAQGSWGKVKSWTGSVTIDATDIRKGEGFSSTMTYKATGDFKITDEMLPDGSHMQWPMPSVETLSDPKQAETAYDRWLTHVVASYEAKGVGESGQPFTVKCTADNRQPSSIGVAVHPTEPTYVFEVSAPEAKFKCSGPSGGPTPNGRLQQAPFRMTGARKAPGPISDTKTFTVGTTTVKMTYNMAPSR